MRKGGPTPSVSWNVMLMLRRLKLYTNMHQQCYLTLNPRW
jgi:hypothetical protein